MIFKHTSYINKKIIMFFTILSLILSSFTFDMGFFKTAKADSLVTVKVYGTFKQSTANEMLSLINNFRTGSDAWYYDSNGEKVYENSLSTLTYDPGLEQSAMQRAIEIALKFSHDRPNGQRSFSVHGDFWAFKGENIAGGYKTVEDAFTAFKEDDEDYAGQGHRRNMLSSDYTHVGLACFEYSGYNFWVQEFATTSLLKPAYKNTDGLTIGKVAVKDEDIAGQSLTLKNSELTLKTGDYIKLSDLITEKVTFADSNYSWPYSLTKPVTDMSKWYLDSDICVIENGYLKALKPGIVHATAVLKVSGEDSVSIPITVTGDEVNSSDITLPSPIPVGDGTEFNLIEPSDSPDSSSNPDSSGIPEVSASPKASEGAIETITPTASVSPYASATPNESTSPVPPDKTSTPNVSSNPYVTASPHATIIPYTSASPNASATPDESASPVPSDNSGVTIPSVTLTFDVFTSLSNGKYTFSVGPEEIEYIQNADENVSKVIFNVKDNLGSKVYTLETDADNLLNDTVSRIYTMTGNTLSVYSSTNYKVNELGNITFSLKKLSNTKTYILLDKTTAEKTDKLILSKIKLSKTKIKLKKNKKYTIHLKKGYNKDSIKNITYKSTKKKVIKVNKKGLVKAKKKGKGIIKMTVTLKNNKKKVLKLKITVR